MDKNVKERMEYEISRIDKLITDAKPLLDLCKLKELDFFENIWFKDLEKLDLKLLHKWYNTNFVKKWFGKEKKEWSYGDIENKYLPYINKQKPTDAFIILHEKIKIGYIQTYLLTNYPEYKDCVKADNNSAGLDLFIGEKDYIHKGLGSIIIKKFLVEKIFINNEIKKCVIGPEPKNISAINAYKKAGFKYKRTIKIPEEDEPEYIMEINKNEMQK